MVDQINSSHFYSYTFDKKQEENIKNLDGNVNIVVNRVNKAVEYMDGRVKDLEERALTKERIAAGVPAVKTDKLTIGGSTQTYGAKEGTFTFDANNRMDINVGESVNISAPKGVSIGSTPGSVGGGALTLGSLSVNSITLNGKKPLTGDYEEWSPADKFAEKAGNWVIDPTNNGWDPVFRGERGGFAYTADPIFNNVDASTHWIEYPVPPKMKQAYVVHLPWESCRYFDICGRLGNDVVFIKRVNAWHPHTNTLNDVNKGSWLASGRNAGVTAVGVSGIDRFDRIRIQGRVGRIHLMGIGWTHEEGRDMETGYVHWDNIYEKNDLKLKSIGRYDEGDWFRIYGTPAQGTAVYNGMSINDGGGLSVGSWEKQPVGNIKASGHISAGGSIATTGSIKAGDGERLCIGDVCITADHLKMLKGEKSLKVGPGWTMGVDGNQVVLKDGNART